ncbi:MAG: hypothetical protein IPI37_02910 [Bacteroidales bacterium]|nr:hypothetical protein [Bacteroidales bacterium]
MRVVDAYAGISNLSGDYSRAWKGYLSARKDYDTAIAGLEKAKADFEYYSHQLEEFRAVKPVAGEQELLEKEQEMLSNASEIKEALSGVTEALGGEEISALSLLRTARTNLARISGWLPGAAELEKRVEVQLIDLNDISYEADKLNDRATADPGRLEYVTRRLDSLYSLMHKHRCRDIDELLAVQKRIEADAAASSDTDEKADELRKRRDIALAQVNSLAGKISEGRRKAVAALSREITGMLHRLGMPHARFEASVTPLPAPGPSGIDDIRFLFSANRQVEPEELSKQLPAASCQG